ncbi:serine hydrolase domain-containing protein [Lutimonas zeaxanthinifaciens]|uniref:serine hydrolase domain-containing protein n=1 Tax=Lutimonas zeaxanthinifaciens TaxID=3060215 RepID=UPI00265CF452|nr:serine hydrolase domain-containing protein [Lutimonas sp. YSD2104]WKK67120.1 serine hydrolase domain-containing protein [Lutimonas sp. YSD2104]
MTTIFSIAKIVIYLSFVLMPFTMLQKPYDFEWPEHRSVKVFKELIKVYDEYDLEKLEGFVRKYYPEESVEKKIKHWAKVYSEFGALEPFKVADKNLIEDSPGIWFRGKDSKNWVQLIIVMSDSIDQITLNPVVRGIRPVGPLPPYSPMPVEKLNEYLKEYMDVIVQKDLFSGNVLVAHGNEILFQGAYGLRDKTLNQRNDLETSFGIASTTKTFTAIAIAQLAETGKLKFSDPISKFIPSYPKDIADQVTIHHLLTHTSGIEFDDYEPFNEATKKAKSFSELINVQLEFMDHMNEGRRSNFKVLNEYDYTNDGFDLLGAVIEKASGLSYARFIEKYIFEPAGMVNSFADIDLINKSANKAKGYSYYDEDHNFRLGKRFEADPARYSMVGGAGGIHSSVSDLYRYFKSINEEVVINGKTKELMFSVHATPYSSEDLDTDSQYGYGFAINRSGKATTIGHDGVDLGIGSRFAYYPEQDIYVIVLSNYGSMAGSNVANHIKDLIEPNFIPVETN